MANAIILHRRRNEKIEPGSQIFTANGVFVAPYSAVYMISFTGSVRASASGGKGGNGDVGLIEESDGRWSYAAVGGGGGGGGGVSLRATLIEGMITLTKGQNVQITINESMVSFGDGSIATGTAPTNGGTGGNAYSGSWTSGSDASPGSGGYAGNPGGTHTVSHSNSWNSWDIIRNTDMPRSASKGKSGSTVLGSYGSGNRANGGGGGSGGTSTDSRKGGSGGTGGYGILGGSQGTGSAGNAGSAAVTGSITVSWGGNE